MLHSSLYSQCFVQYLQSLSCKMPRRIVREIESSEHLAAVHSKGRSNPRLRIFHLPSSFSPHHIASHSACLQIRRQYRPASWLVRGVNSGKSGATTNLPVGIVPRPTRSVSLQPLLHAVVGSKSEFCWTGCATTKSSFADITLTLSPCILKPRRSLSSLISLETVNG